MSDIHAQTPQLVKVLYEYINLDEFLVLAAGDMAGKNVYGSDGDPTLEYEFLNSKSKEFYFVQGNHDLPDKNRKHEKIKNRENKFAYIKNGKTVKTGAGKIGGVNGIISNRDHPYKMSKYKYFDYLEKALKSRLDVLMTHEAPSINAFYNDGTRYIGNEEMFNMVKKYRPKIHIFGHVHHPVFYHFLNGVHYINTDARVIVCFPIGMVNDSKYFKSKLKDLFLLNSK